jgi:hypothetical protein
VHDEIVIEQAKRSDLIVRRDRLVEAIAGGDMQPRAVLEKISQLDDEIAACEARVQVLEAEVSALNIRQQVSNEALEALREVSEALNSKQGDEQFLFRAKLNEHLRRVIERLALFPGGKIHTPDEVAHIKAELLQSGRYAPEDIDSYVTSELQLTPRKHERFFVIRNRNEVFQILRPDSAAPQIIEVMARNPGLVAETLRLMREQAESAAART